MRTLKSAACLAVVFAVAGCGPQIDLTERPLFSNGSNTITFLMYDAFTGAPITDGEVTMQIGAYSLTADHPNTNTYLVSQVPGGAQMTTFSAPGHLSMVAQPSGDCFSALTSPTNQCFKLYQVPLYPEGQVQQDVVVRAFDQESGAPITTGSVVATLTNAGSIGTSYTNQLNGVLALRPTTIQVSLDSTGTAILPKASLVLGATYSIDIFGATNSAGSVLVPEQNQTVTVGVSFTQLTVFMGPPGEAPVATHASNENFSQASPNLVVDFPYPVIPCRLNKTVPMNWNIDAGGLDVNGNGVLVTRASPDPVRVVPAEGQSGTTVTWTVLFATAASTGQSSLEPGDGLVDLYFTNVGVKVVGTSNYCWPLTWIDLRNTGDTVNDTIHVQ